MPGRVFDGPIQGQPKVTLGRISVSVAQVSNLPYRGFPIRRLRRYREPADLKSSIFTMFHVARVGNLRYQLRMPKN
jgi:hypothetical protein